MVEEISAVELKKKLDDGDDFQLIDVRQPDEYAFAKIDGAKLIPLGEIPSRMGELDPNKEVILHCKMGGRSAKAIRELEEKFGFDNLYNLKGGILGYIDEVQPELTKY